MKDVAETPSRFQRLLLWVRRYVTLWLIVVIAFIIYIYFYASDTSIGSRAALQRQIDSLRREIAAYTDSVTYYRELNAALGTDPATMERVIREHYHMKHPDEDVYIFE